MKDVLKGTTLEVTHRQVRNDKNPGERCGIKKLQVWTCYRQAAWARERGSIQRKISGHGSAGGRYEPESLDMDGNRELQHG